MATSAKTPASDATSTKSVTGRAEKRCRCPRCRYDLSGETDTWPGAGRCPVEGTCPECGLTFLWGDLFRENISPGYIESEERVRIRWLWKTCWRALRPWSFWRWVRMEVGLRPKRIAWAFAFGVLFWLLSGPVLHAVVGGVGSAIVGRPGVFVQISAPPRRGSTATTHLGWQRLPSSWDIGFGLDSAFGAAVTPFTGVRGDHVTLRDIWWEGATYSLPIILYPLAVGFMGGLYLMLDTTRKRAKVSYEHVLRATFTALLALPWAFTFLWLLYLPGTVGYYIDQANIGWLQQGGVYVDELLAWPERFEPLIWCTLAVWPVLWFGFAGSRYMKIERPWIVAVVHGVAMLLFVPVAMIVIDAVAS